MRNRLVGTYVALLALVLLALEIPLAVNMAANRTEAMVIDRLVEAVQLASLADPALRTGRWKDLDAQAHRYRTRFGTSTAVVDASGTLVAVTGDRRELHTPDARRRLARALAGERSGAAGTVWPWQDRPLAIAVPVTSGGEVVGAVLTLSPTDAMRGRVRRAWLLLCAAGLAAGLVCVAFALALSRWILRPVGDLGAAAARISAGALDARVPAAPGPPELRELARSFNAMADSLAAALARQRAFIAQASHQLRNPLTALRLRVEGLGDFIGTAPPRTARDRAAGGAGRRPGDPDPAERGTDPGEGGAGRTGGGADRADGAADAAWRDAGRQEHRIALEEADRLARILDGLLALARAESDHVAVEVVDAAAVADERVAAWQPVAAERQVTLCRSGPASALASAVPTAVGQSLDALIDNALKFAGPRATVRVAVRSARTAVHLHVIDDGPGLSDEGRRRATERFWRAPDAQNTDGSGLGLPIVVALVEASGGRLDLLPVRPRGLEARLRFPSPARARVPRIATDDPRGADGTAAQAPPGTAGTATQGPPGRGSDRRSGVGYPTQR